MGSEPWTSFGVMTCHSRSRFRSFSGFSPMMRPVPPTLKKLAGAKASSVRVAMPLASPSASPLVPVSCAAGKCLSRYETAFGILHKLRAGMVRPDRDRIGGKLGEHVEIDETWVGGRTRGEGRGVHHKVLVACAVEVRHRKPGTTQDKRKDGRHAGRVRFAVVPDRSADSLCGFVESAVAPGALTVTDDWSGYASLGDAGV